MDKKYCEIVTWELNKHEKRKKQKKNLEDESKSNQVTFELQLLSYTTYVLVDIIGKFCKEINLLGTYNDFLDQELVLYVFDD